MVIKMKISFENVMEVVGGENETISDKEDKPIHVVLLHS